MALCHLAAAEIGALVVLRALGVPDVITFTLFGMIIITLAYWIDKMLSTKGIRMFGRKIIGKRESKYQKVVLVGLCFVITLFAYWMMGLL
ncbi:MAG: hypothetical protein WA139_05380 [Candidatus Aenigmatarchaeota archaeon]